MGALVHRPFGSLEMKPALQIPYFLGKGRLHPKGCRLELRVSYHETSIEVRVIGAGVTMSFSDHHIHKAHLG